MYIVIEGPDGSGKTTIARMLADTLSSVGYDVVSVREPGGCPQAEVLRDLIMSLPKGGPCSDILMFSTAREMTSRSVIIPALRENKVVISDRNYVSTYVYQVAEEESNSCKLLQAITSAGASITPDLTIILTATAEVLLSRIQSKGDINRYDPESLDEVRAICRKYWSAASARGYHFGQMEYVSTASNSPLDTLTHIINILKRRGMISEVGQVPQQAQRSVEGLHPCA